MRRPAANHPVWAATGGPDDHGGDEMLTAILMTATFTALVRLRAKLAAKSRAEQVAHAKQFDAEFAEWLKG